MKSKLQGPLYAMAEIGINCVEVFIRLHLLVFYTEHVRLSSTLAGLALGLAVFWDALIDPFVGWLSDVVQLKSKNRFQFLLLGAVVSSGALFLITHPFEMTQSIWQFLFLFTVALILNSGFTFLSVPYSALVGDLADNEKSRTTLIGWRLAFSNFGAIAGIAIPSYFLKIQQSKESYQSATYVIAGLVVVTSLITWISSYLHKPYMKSDYEQKSIPFSFSEIWKPLKDTAFRKLLLGYFIANIGLAFNSALALYYYRLRLKFSETEIETVLLVFLFVITFSIPIWIWMSRRHSKIRLVQMGIGLLGLMGLIVYPLLPPGSLWPTVIFASVLGGFCVGSSILLESYLTDHVKATEVAQKRDLLGSYFGIWKMAGKASRGMALAITGVVLTWCQIEDTSQDYLRLALAFGPLVSLFFVLSVWPIRTLKQKPG